MTDRPTHFDDGDDEECLNTLEDLAEGIVKTRENTSNEYTILLVGETGTGKTSFLSLLANVLAGRSPNDYAFSHDGANEAGGGDRHSQTNTAKLYEFKSKNGVIVRILDTPGLADTRGIAQDEKHKENIARVIKDNILAVNAVLILANGTLPRLSAATDYALSTLSSIFPRSLVENIAIIFTNVSAQLSLNFDQNSLPESLKNPENQFRLDNPIALWKNYLARCSRSGVTRRERSEWRAEIHEKHQKALRMFLSLFDWLDTLVPQPTTDILRLYSKTQDIEQKIFHYLDYTRQLAIKEVKLKEILSDLDSAKSSKEQYQDYARIVNEKIWVQYRFSDKLENLMCRAPGCQTNCTFDISGWDVFMLGLLQDFWAKSLDCKSCSHSYYHHHLSPMRWHYEDLAKVVIDTDIFQRYNDAKSEQERQEVLKIAAQETVDQLRREIENCLGQVQVLMTEYAELSLSGSMAGHVRKTIVLLELHLEATRQNGDVDSARNVEESLKRMKQTLEILERARTRNEST
ncbi:hypothetical protein M378DRAFT_312135 [Amanita muscaria Koide BX008]|uniref:AIG1-type G domain-containing protein n=1 Tax=Amanita muscaria (strain Koide BX008) TaxID=946122 RepID=A0A0C2SWV0_AMAMK|nr:hypothetical protein M378DRAFT_312135 [Amanita muscaria Koide BX008]